MASPCTPRGIFLDLGTRGPRHRGLLKFPRHPARAKYQLPFAGVQFFFLLAQMSLRPNWHCLDEFPSAMARRPLFFHHMVTSQTLKHAVRTIGILPWHTFQIYSLNLCICFSLAPKRCQPPYLLCAARAGKP